MAAPVKTILLLGESSVGKSHYGAQLLKRLMQEDGGIRMHGAATNLEPFESVVASLDMGLAADHTATSVYHESRWPIVNDDGLYAYLIWPDYGGEQVKDMIDDRQIPLIWLKRITQSSAWLLMIRLQTTRVDGDVFSRPPYIVEREQQRIPGRATFRSSPFDRVAPNTALRPVDIKQAYEPVTPSRYSPDLLGRDTESRKTDQHFARTLSHVQRFCHKQLEGLFGARTFRA